jgi:S-ribosylhomocysteine lyase LuxS involved in autoinducer biosynthesis
MGERTGFYRVLVGKPQVKRPLGRPRHSWEGNIKIDLQEVRCGCMDWIKLAQDRDRCWALVNVVMNLWVP